VNMVVLDGADIHHHGQTDDLWARLEVAKGDTFCHRTTLNARPARLGKFSSDRASGRVLKARQRTHFRMGPVKSVERQPPCPRAILAGFQAAEVGVSFNVSG